MVVVIVVVFPPMPLELVVLVPNALVLVPPVKLVPVVALVVFVPVPAVPLVVVVVLVVFVFDPLLVPPKLIRRFAVNVALQMRTFVRFVTAEIELVVTPFVSVTVAIGLLATAFVSMPETTFVLDEIKLVSATELVVEKALTGGVVIAGVPIVKTLFEVPDIVVVPNGVVVPNVFVFVTPRPAALLLAIKFARFVSVMLATLVAITPVELPAVVLVEVVPVVGEVPAFPNSTAANAAMIPLVVAAWFVSKVAFVPPRARSPVKTNCSFPLRFPLLLLFCVFWVIIAVPIEFVSSGTNMKANCCICFESLVVPTSWN